MVKDKTGYPADFVSRVKAEFPDLPSLHSALDDGRDLVGRFLDDNGDENIEPETIIELIDAGKVDELRAEAQKLCIRGELYREWQRLAKEMFQL